ncbi:MAG: hypothetical protein E7270_09450 [Lachnospiraceae bacterium]|nr:hypothetical protein [Lachnospiraceae bacterium]
MTSNEGKRYNNALLQVNKLKLGVNVYNEKSNFTLNQVVKESDFNMDKDEMLEYALHYVEQYQDIAEVSNMSFVEYGKKSFDFSEKVFELMRREGTFSEKN